MEIGPIASRIGDPFAYSARMRSMARARLAPQPEVPGLATRRIAADIIDGVLQRARPLDEQLDGKQVQIGRAHV